MQEESKNKKEKWGKPKLIILIRGKTEERVLTACKTSGGGPGGPSSANARCQQTGYCDACSLGTPS